MNGNKEDVEITDERKPDVTGTSFIVGSVGQMRNRAGGHAMAFNGK
jgi:hypothetical protein